VSERTKEKKKKRVLKLRFRHRHHHHQRDPPYLPGETLFIHINSRKLVAFSDRTSDIVTKTASATDTNSHCTNLSRLLSRDKSTNIRLTREHLDRSTGRVNLLCALGPSDEEENAKTIASLLHGQDLSHPGSNPLEVLGALQNPHEHNIACCTGTVGIAAYKSTGMRHGIRDTNTSSEQHDMTIRFVRVAASIGALDECVGEEFAARSVLGFLPERVGETSAAANDQRHGGLSSGQHVDCIGWQLLGGQVQAMVNGCLVHMPIDGM
jgi:hypothetical protein